MELTDDMLSKVTGGGAEDTYYIIEGLCDRCWNCITSCPSPDCFRPTGYGGYQIDASLCLSCGCCADACGCNAIHVPLQPNSVTVYRKK